ncbi:MAG: putative metal-binding motif-containing protein [bacterium]
MRKIPVYYIVYCLVLCVAFLLPASSWARQVLIFRGGSIDQVENLISFSSGLVATAMEIRVASWETGYDQEDYLVYDPLTNSCLIYQDIWTPSFPDPATIEEALASEPYVIYDLLSESELAPAYMPDSDGDGIADIYDRCPHDPNKAEPGECGCGLADTDSDGDGVPGCKDCDDTKPGIHPGALEVCNGFDDDCNNLEDEEGAEGCIFYYRDNDEDDYGLEGDMRCLCEPEGSHTATRAGDPDDSDPDIAVRFEMVLPIGWNMISLPLIPKNSRVGVLFPDAGAVFRFADGYEPLGPDDTLMVGEGYWMYLGASHRYVLQGRPIEVLTIPAVRSGWSMIGGCSGPARGWVAHGHIRAIFGFRNGYYLLEPAVTLEAGKGYWVNCSEPGPLTIEMVGE